MWGGKGVDDRMRRRWVGGTAGLDGVGWSTRKEVFGAGGCGYEDLNGILMRVRWIWCTKISMMFYIVTGGMMGGGYGQMCRRQAHAVCAPSPSTIVRNLVSLNDS